MVSGTNTFANLIFHPPSCSSSFVGLVLLSALSLESWKSLCGGFRCWFKVSQCARAPTNKGLGILWWCHPQLVCLTDLGSSWAVRLRSSWDTNLCPDSPALIQRGRALAELEQILTTCTIFPRLCSDLVSNLLWCRELLKLSVGEGGVYLTEQLQTTALGSRGAVQWNCSCVNSVVPGVSKNFNQQGVG